MKINTEKISGYYKISTAMCKELSMKINTENAYAGKNK